jgi:D-glycero-D-manno-heptose 1,7-bisphosphate phosphatase
MTASKRLFIFDKDGTLVAGFENRPANTPSEQEVLPGVKQTLTEIRENGDSIAIATNQGGVAFGYMTEREVDELVDDAARKVGGVDFAVFCPHHPDGTIDKFAKDCPFRKPNPGMIDFITDLLEFDKSSVVFVGDSTSDEDAARNAGVEFCFAEDFFGWHGDSRPEVV